MVSEGIVREGPEAIRKPGFRERHHRAIWAALWPVRAWFRHFPVHRGKGLIHRWIILPALPPQPAAFDHRFGDGFRVSLFYREDLGTKVLLEGGYEPAEAAELCRHVGPGSTVIDAGANIGLTALELARAVEPGGQVIAFEPHPRTAARLRENLVRNGIENAVCIECALADRTGRVTFHESADATLNSATAPPRNLVRSFEVPADTLDRVWRERGAPRVWAIKIDVEGGELAVLRGAKELLARDRPAILLEAWGPEQLAPIEALLGGLGYAWRQPAGFEPRNYLFLRDGAAAPETGL